MLEVVENDTPYTETPDIQEAQNQNFANNSGVDYCCNNTDNNNKESVPPTYFNTPPQTPPYQGQSLSGQPLYGQPIPGQPMPGQPASEYTFNGNYTPPGAPNYPNYPNNPYKPPVPPQYPPYYNQPNYSGNSVGGSYNYQTNDNAYRNAMNKTKRKPAKALIAIAVVVSILLVGGVFTAGVLGIRQFANNGSVTNTTADDNSDSSLPSIIQSAKTPEGALTIPEIIKKVKPSVVGVEATDVGSGTGIVMTKDGYILTNAHVVSGATSYTVVTYDGKQYEAKLKGLDSVSDIAVLKVDGTDFTPAEFGTSADVVEGETVIAMGNPYGLDLQNTTTAGIISAVRNDITLGDTTMDLLQTDASINPGNSGGPLLNQYGLVIGITSLKIMSNSGYTSEGLGFAIPIDTAKPIVNEIIAYGYLKGRPMVGITGQYLDEEYAAVFGKPAGILVQSTTAGTDAAKKLQQYDMITKINGIAFTSMDEFNAEKNKYQAGDTIKLTVTRDDKEITVDLILSENTGS